MNEYTRREEVRWTLTTAAVLLLAVAIAVVVLATARGAIIPDPEARARADRLSAQAKDAAACSTAALKLQEEIGIFKNEDDRSCADGHLSAMSRVVAPTLTAPIES